MRRLLHLLYSVGGVQSESEGWKDALKRARHPVIFMAFFLPSSLFKSVLGIRGGGEVDTCTFFYYFQL